jgi:uncharacterized membrane protein
MMIQRRRRLLADRPDYKKTDPAPVDWILEFLSLAGLLILWGMAFYYFRKLPETIPTHFNMSGQPDDFGSKSSFWTLPAVGLVIYIGFTLLVKIPEKFNYPITITPANAQRQYLLAIRMIRTLKGVIQWIFFLILLVMVRSAFHGSAKGVYMVPVILVLATLPIIIYFILALRNK